MSKKLYIGVDFGGSKIKVGLITGKGEILTTNQIPTINKKTGKPSLDGLFEAVDSVWDKQVEAIGIGMAGLIDSKKGTLVSAPNLPKSWKGLNIADLVRKKYKRPVTIDNDVHCFTLGEFYFGTAKEADSMFGLTVGTGIGGGVITNKEFYRGHNNAAGEVGHMTIAGECGFICSCGHIGHFESMVALDALNKRYQEITGEMLFSEEIAAKAKKGNRDAKRAIEETGYWLGVGLAAVAQAFNPEMIVVSGGMAGIPGLLTEAKLEFKKQVIYRPLQKTKIVRSKLKGNAVILGAAYAAINTKKK